MEKGASFEFKSYETSKALKAFAWSFSSALVALAISLLASVEVPVHYVAFVPVVNTVLYALSQYIADNRDK